MEKTVLEMIENEIKRDLPDIDVKLSLEIFNNILLSDVPKELEGVKERFPRALMTFFNNESSNAEKAKSVTDILNIEPVLRLILVHVNYIEYERITSQKDGFMQIIKSLNLNPDNENLNKDSYRFKGKPGYIEQLAQAYQIRNIESHACKSWSMRELYYNIDCVIETIVACIYKHSDVLKNIKIVSNDINVTEYMDELINNFKDKMKKFIMLNGEENLNVANKYISEFIDDDNSNENNLESKTNENNTICRAGTIDDIRKKHIPEKRMMIWGTAGAGKSTTMEYLVYKDAQDHKKNNKKNIPVFIPLGLLTDPNQTLMQYIQKKTRINEDNIEQLLKNGKINLFLDGINEIPDNQNNTMKKLRLKEIQSIINTYENTFMIMTNRPEEHSTFKSIPVFNLLEMDIDQIKQFLQFNTQKNETVDCIYNEIMSNERLKKVVCTPLMLSRLIEIVDNTGKIPENEGKIIAAFLDNLILREIDEKKETMFGLDKANMLLTYIAHEGMNNSSTNSGMKQKDIINYMNLCMNENNFKTDPFYCLNIFCQLGIMMQKDSQYVFYHQLYQEYYVSQYMHLEYCI